MKIIRLWFSHLNRAEYTIHWRDSRHCLSDYFEDSFYYTEENAKADFEARAEEFRETWKKYGDEIVYPFEVGYMLSFLVPIKDGVTLPDEPGNLFSPFDGVDANDEPLYIADGHPTEISPEMEYPQIGLVYSVFEDGMILHGSGKEDDIIERGGFLASWKSRGWDGKIEIVDVIQQ